MHIIEIKRQNKGRLLVRTDEVGTFPIYEKEAAAFHIAEDADICDADWENICEEVLLPRAERRALHLLERQDRTEAQLRRKLTEGLYPEFIVDEAVEYVRSYHYIDDLRYASNYIRYHQDGKSRRQILQTLQSRGVPRDIIDRAFSEAYESDEGELIDRLLEKRGYDPETADERERARTWRYLSGRGFSASEIRRHILKASQSDI